MKGMKVRKSCEDFIKLEKAAQQKWCSILLQVKLSIMENMADE